MSCGLTTTFELLGEAENDAATGVLLAALDASQREIRDQALTALLKRHSGTAELNILGRWNDLSLRWKTQVAERVGWLSGAIRKAVLARDARLYECGCSAAVFTRDYDLIPVFVQAAVDRANPYAVRAAAATLELAELLSEELAAPRDYRIRRDPQLQRQHVLAGLERAAAQFDEHGRRELLEAYVLLASREDAVLKRILQSPTDRSFLPLVEVLTNTSRPGAQRLLLSYLDDPHAPLPAIHIIGRRSDVSFLRQLARKISAEPTPVIQANLKRIESLPWITGNLGVLDALSETEQPGAVHLAGSSSAPRHHALEAIAHVLRQGHVPGRRAAAKVLGEFRGPEASELALRSLTDSDPLVRAACAAQLRQRNVPGAINRLLQLLDSPHQAEREAAQAGLSEFRFERFAANFDNLSPEARRSAGPIVRRVDPQAIDQIRAELEAPTRGRRKRALEMSVALSAVLELQPLVAALLKDEDQYLRIEAIRALAPIDTPAVRQLLRDALLDPQPLVQQAAEAALAGAETVPSPNAEQKETVKLTGRPPTQSRKTLPPGSVPMSSPTETWSSSQAAALRR
ncbi:MAG TPA: HEAT repeat domain-containing protein [Pirellulaceae bacterium]|nr:HEAT repeat domain-containing protein [Pirellulaceae bacterium]